MQVDIGLALHRFVTQATVPQSHLEQQQTGIGGAKGHIGSRGIMPKDVLHYRFSVGQVSGRFG